MEERNTMGSVGWDEKVSQGGLTSCSQNRVNIHSPSSTLRSGEFNQMMTKLANQKGFTINEYNLEHLDSGKEVDHVFQVEKMYL